MVAVRSAAMALACVLLMWLASVPITGIAADEEALFAEGFEDGATDWTQTGPGEGDQDCTKAYEGDCSFRFVPSGTGVYTTYERATDIPFDDSLRFSVAYRASSNVMDGDTFLRLVFNDGSHVTFSFNDGINNGVRLITSEETGERFWSRPHADTWYRFEVDLHEGARTTAAYAFDHTGLAAYSKHLPLSLNATRIVGVAITGVNWGSSQTNHYDELRLVSLPAGVRFLADPATPTQNETVHLVDLSTPQADIETRHWDLGNGENATGSEANVTYPEPGTYTICLTIGWTNGTYDGDCKDIIVGNLRPVAWPSFPRHAMVHEEITFDGSASYDPDGHLVALVWSFSDGDVPGAVVTRSFSGPGTEKVCLTVTDDDGSSDVSCGHVEVAFDLTASFAPSAPKVGAPVRFSANTSFDAEGLSWLWEFDDGTYSKEATPVHHFATHGDHWVRVTAFKDGARSSAELVVPIQPVQYHGEASVFRSATQGVSVTLFGTRPIDTQDEGVEEEGSPVLKVNPWRMYGVTARVEAAYGAVTSEVSVARVQSSGWHADGEASGLHVTARASCSTGFAATVVGGLDYLGVQLNLSDAAPNTTVEMPRGTLTLNERFVDDEGRFVVRAVHYRGLDGSFVIGEARAGVTACT